MQNFGIGIGCSVRNGISDQVLEQALKDGVRYFDTSTLYQVAAIARFEQILEQFEIDRKDAHLSLKLWVTELSNNRSNDSEYSNLTLRAIYEKHLKKFNVRRFDSVVLHWPLKVDSAGLPDEFRIEELWPQMEYLVHAGMTTGIGVSNFNIVAMHRLLDIASVPPCSVQIEYSPFAHDDNLVNFCKQNDITVFGHSPFHFGWKDGHVKLFDESILKEIAHKHGLTVPQIILAWAMAKGVIPVAGTTNVDHVRQIADARYVDALTEDEIHKISNLNRNDYNYLELLNYFGEAHHRKYILRVENLFALQYNDKGIYEEISIYQRDFVSVVRHALTEGPGFIIIPHLFQDNADLLKERLKSQRLSSFNRWSGFGPHLDSILNCGKEVWDMVDDPLISLIVESLLGWDCKLDNISLSTSRIAPDSAAFGPHQDSPFDHNPGAPLPPASYPIVLQCVVAIDEFRDDNGALYVIPHSHKRRQRVNLPWQGDLPPGEVPEGAVKAIVPKGSVIIAVGHIWHGTYANESKSDRLGLLIEFVCSFCDARDKFTVSTVRPTLVDTCSRRMIRLLNDGKLHHADVPGLLNAFKTVRMARRRQRNAGR